MARHRREVGEDGPAVLFAPASGREVGGGHVMRDAALATALATRGAVCDFAVTPAGAAILDRFFPRAFAVHVTPRGEVAALAGLAGETGADAVVFDDYALGAEAERALAAPGRVVMAIDDLADRPHAVDLLIDPGYGRRAQDYAAVAPGAALHVGSAYALLRPAFAQPPPLREAGPLRRLFLSFGLSDVRAVAARAAGLARSRLPDVVFDVALAATAESLPRLRALAEHDPALRLHVDEPEVAPLMGAADAGIGAGGSSVWERCALGLPSLAVVVADNQRSLVETLDREGVLIGCDLAAPDFEARFAAGLGALAEPERRRDLAARSRILCDGRGAERAAEALLAAIRARS